MEFFCNGQSPFYKKFERGRGNHGLHPLMTKVTREEFCRFIWKWRMVVDLNYTFPITGGRYRQKTYYSMNGVSGNQIVPNLDNPLGAITYDGTIPIKYHVNQDAVEEQ